jgi:hypothetical protein
LVKQVWALLVLGLLAASFVALPVAHAQTTGYLQEFSESGEQGVLDSTWAFLTHDGVQRSIDVYRYGSVLVAFDQTGLSPLKGSQAIDFFQSYELRTLVSTGQLSEASYSISFQQSIACAIAVPEFGDQASNLAVAQASNAIQKVLPDGASAIAADLVSVGEDVGMIKDVNPYALALGAACYGGDLIQNYASSQMASCAAYIQNLQSFKAYEGMATDLINCHDAAIQKLQTAQYSPDVLTQYGETTLSNLGIQISNAFGSAWCYLASCQSVPQQLSVSELDQVSSQINALKAVDPLLQGTSAVAQSDAVGASNRIEMKASEASQAITQLSTQISSINSALAGHQGMGGFVDALMAPPFNTSETSALEAQAASLQYAATAYSQEYKYNSAISAASQGMSSAEGAAASLEYQASIPRSVATWVYELLLVIAVIVVVGVAWRYTK